MVELYRIAPKSAVAESLQCCSKSAAKRTTVPLMSYSTSRTSNRPSQLAAPATRAMDVEAVEVDTRETARASIRADGKRSAADSAEIHTPPELVTRFEHTGAHAVPVIAPDREHGIRERVFRAPSVANTVSCLAVEYVDRGLPPRRTGRCRRVRRRPSKHTNTGRKLRSIRTSLEEGPEGHWDVKSSSTTATQYSPCAIDLRRSAPAPRSDAIAGSWPPPWQPARTRRSAGPPLYSRGVAGRAPTP